MNSPSPDFISAAKSLLGEAGYSTDPERLIAHASPWRGTYQGYTPFAAYPSSSEQTAALVKLCAEHGVSITPQGGNTSLVDGGTPHGEILVSTGRMTRIRNVDPTNNSLIVEAGAPLVSVQDAAEEHDRFFPLSLGSEGTATIGGLISTNAGGVAVLRYGMMRDLILGLEVVLPDGRIWHGLNELRKNNTGYDLKHLFAGAEGTLGLITAASLKLFPKNQTATAWACLESAKAATDLLSLVRTEAGDTVTSFELVPRNAVEMVVADEVTIRDPLPHPSDWRVLIEISMTDVSHAQNVLERSLEKAFESGLIVDAAIATSQSQANDLWRIRETIPLSKRAFGTAISHDVSVPVSAIPDFLAATQAALDKRLPGIEIVAFGHVGDGNLHYSACEAKSVSQPLLAQAANDITEIVHNQVISFGGSISAEHGVGRLKKDEVATLKVGPEIDIMRAIKAALDPRGLMNPGRVVDV
ncbi:MAG: FAD-binding oxidoreductase [Pseudomonadota bacterium]